MKFTNRLRRKIRTAGKLCAELVGTWRNSGARAAARYGVAKATAFISEKTQGNKIHGAVVSANFDQEYGVDTTGLIPMAELTVDSPNSLYATVYKATDPNRFAEGLARLPISHRDFDFIDLGSGKGLVLLLASHYPFRRVRGVEFARELHAVAQSNIGKYRNPARQCQDVASICDDAGSFDYPKESTLIYMYHPFDEELMVKVAAHVEQSYQSSPRPIIVFYTQPRLRSVWEALPCFRLMLDAPNQERDGHMKVGYAVFATPEADWQRTL